MKTIKDILQIKGTNIWSVEPEMTVFEALKVMSDADIGAVLVMKSEKLVGILSERDYARKIIIKGKTSKDTLVSEIMTEKIYFIPPDVSVENALALMTEKHIRHLPVMESVKVIGVISIGDIVKAIISEQRDTIEQLEKYVMGGK